MEESEGGMREGGVCLVVLLQMTRPNAMVRGEDEDDSVAITTSMGEGGGAAAGLK